MTTLKKAARQAMVKFDRERRASGEPKWNLDDLYLACAADLAAGIQNKTVIHTPLDQARTALSGARGEGTGKGREFLRQLVCDRHLGATVKEFYDYIVALGNNDTINLMALAEDDFDILDVAENENASKAVARCNAWNANKSFVISAIRQEGTLGKAIESGRLDDWRKAA